MNSRFRHSLLCLLLLLSVGLTGVCGLTSTWWLNTTFPGFFVLENRVVASISLPHWSLTAHPEIYQQAVVAINGQPVASASALYEQVRTLPAGVPVTYTLQQNDQRTDITLPTARFTFTDWTLLFGVYLVNGLALALIGLVAWYRSPTSAAGSALLSFGLTLALFIITATDLYAPYWFFRLHILGETFFPAAAVHLALVFPRERLGRRRAFRLALLYGAAGVLGLAYEIFLHQPAAYSLLHNLCTVYAGVAGCFLLGKMVWDYGATTLADLRRKIRVVVLGSLTGYGFPTVLMLMAGLHGGQVAVNYAAFTLFVFPLSIGYVLFTHDLLGLERVLKQSVSALMGLVVIVLCCGGGAHDARAALIQEKHEAPPANRVVRYELLYEHGALPDLSLIARTTSSHTRTPRSLGRETTTTASPLVRSGSLRQQAQSLLDLPFRAPRTAWSSTLPTPFRYASLME